MEQYAPSRMELAPRDIVARAEQSEIDAGRGVNGEDYIHLDLRHLGEARIMERLPQIRQLGIDFIGVDCVKDPLPIQPSAHYSMGGIPTDMFGQVILDADKTPMEGFFAAGECACVSVHGANRLGTNSLLDATVFGGRAGRTALEYAKKVEFGKINGSHVKARVLDQIEEIFQRDGSESYNQIRNEMKEVMMDKCGVFRDEEKLKSCIATIQGLKERYKKGKVTDKGQLFNSELYEIVELGNMLEMAEIISTAALARKESRGGHHRTDFPKRDDENFLKHSLVYPKDGQLELKYKPVVVTRYQPKERTY
jgi:succinate dehydrogenase / fumarate reductase flavoprotein subunit